MTPQTAKKIRHERYRHARIANGATVQRGCLVGGHLRVSGDEVRAMLAPLHKRLTWSRIERLAGIGKNVAWQIGTGRVQNPNPVTARKIAALWRDYCAPIERDTRTFSADPLLRLVLARYGSLRASGVQAQIYRLGREGLTWRQCEQWAARFGALPEELWPEWIA